MEELVKKLNYLISLAKALNSAFKLPEPAAMPKIKDPGQSKPKKTQIKEQKLPGVSPDAKKDPKKIAEQIKHAKEQKLKKPSIKQPKIQ